MEDFFHLLVGFYEVEYILSITRSPASPKLVVKYKHSLGLLLIVPCFLELRPH